MNKWIKSLLIVPFLVVSMSGCNDKQKNSDSVAAFDPDENLNLEQTFFDDFTDGIDPEKWSIGNEKWGTDNNGVVAENVSYTADGVVVLQANGDYYDGDIKGINANNGKRTGSVIISRETLGPGRYEAKMMCMPRFGATTAMWTFYYDQATAANHEIDIELNVDDFHNSLFTNWVTEEDKTSRSVYDENLIHNDGKWHTYKFEWHTNPMRIDYYIDDHLYFTSTSNIPTYAGRLWIGNWFPANWAGTPDFETDYMFVDWVRYTPYDNNPYIPTDIVEAPNLDRYPTEPLATMPINNLISNAGFDHDESAWRRDLTSQVRIVPEEGKDQSSALLLPENDITYQFITGLDESFKMYFEAYVKYDPSTYGNNSYILFEYRPLKTELLGKYELVISTENENYVADEYYKISCELTLPAGTKRIELSLIGGSKGSIYLDDLYFNLTEKAALRV